jgi:O-antigen biosynthesis protein
VRAYLRQQRAYGAAEALLERKWPERYAPDGHAHWVGRLYGRGLAAPFGRTRVHYGHWGAEPFQALYSPATGALSSLTARPAWHVVLLALATLSVAGIWWSPLLVAVPLLALAVLVSLLPGTRAAARASFMYEDLPRRRRFGMWTLTTLLHAAQPLARIRGRAHPPAWRTVIARAAMPWPHTVQVWSEEWRSAEDRLADVERALRQDGVPVFTSCAFGRWDLHARGGLFGSARLRLGLEEHGGGRQLVRFRISPAVPAAAVASLAVVTLAAASAELTGAWGASAVLSVTALVLAACLVRGCALAVGAFVHHVAPRAATAPDRAHAIAVRET